MDTRKKADVTVVFQRRRDGSWRYLITAASGTFGPRLAYATIDAATAALDGVNTPSSFVRAGRMLGGDSWCANLSWDFVDARTNATVYHQAAEASPRTN